MIPLIIQDQFYTIQNIQRSPITQTSNWSGHFDYQLQVERENQERIDRENRILLRKILEQHHGIRRSTSIPAPAPTHR